MRYIDVYHGLESFSSTLPLSSRNSSCNTPVLSLGCCLPPYGRAQDISTCFHVGHVNDVRVVCRGIMGSLFPYKAGESLLSLLSFTRLFSAFPLEATMVMSHPAMLPIICPSSPT